MSDFLTFLVGIALSCDIVGIVATDRPLQAVLRTMRSADSVLLLQSLAAVWYGRQPKVWFEKPARARLLCHPCLPGPWPPTSNQGDCYWSAGFHTEPSGSKWSGVPKKCSARKGATY